MKKKKIVYLGARETAVKTAESKQCAWKNEMSLQDICMREHNQNVKYT